MRLTLPLVATLAVTTLFLQGCWNPLSRQPAEPPAPIQPKVTGLPAEVPDYVLNSDASVVNRTEDDRMLRVEMTTINGITSPIAYYRKTLVEKGWRLEGDNAGDRGGTITAVKDGKEMRVAFSIDDGQTKIVITLQK
ncbi:MAG: hypothetical protein WC698_00445 [Candidatus Peribacteraceae bacterium]